MTHDFENNKLPLNFKEEEKNEDNMPSPPMMKRKTNHSEAQSDNHQATTVKRTENRTKSKVHPPVNIH